MDLSNIIALSGKPGLFEIKIRTRSGVVAVSLLDGKRTITNSTAQLSVLEDIQVYCIGEEIPLTTVFQKILDFESGALTRVSPKSSEEELEAYFFEILDNYDEERVYPSDIKKIMQWYNLLIDKKRLTVSKKKTTPEQSKEKNKEVKTPEDS